MKALQSELDPATALIPVLIELGDHAIGRSTHPEAVCWSRAEATQWLKAGVERAVQAGTTPGTTVAYYLALFEAWDTAQRVRGAHRALIKTAQEAPDAPPEWRLIEHWLRVGELGLYQELLLDPVLSDVLRNHGLAAAMHGRMKSGNDHLKITKRAWTLRPVEGMTEGVNIHFEARRVGGLRLDIELHPYVGSLGKKPDECERLRAQIELKAELHQRIRAALQQTPGLSVNMRGLRAADAVATCTAAKFPLEVQEKSEPAQLAEAMARVIDAVSQVVDASIGDDGGSRLAQGPQEDEMTLSDEEMERRIAEAPVGPTVPMLERWKTDEEEGRGMFVIEELPPDEKAGDADAQPGPSRDESDSGDGERDG